MAETEIITVNSDFITTKKEVFTGSDYSNTLDIANEVDPSFSETDYNQYQILNLLLSTPISDEEQLKEVYLKSYKQLIKLFINSSSQSVFLKDKSTDTNFSGLDILKNINFLDFIDIQEIKDKVTNFISNDPCVLMDSSPKQSVHPLRGEMIRTNFISVCRLHIVYLKLSSLFICSVFDNNEFVQKDSSFISFAFDTFKQKLISNISNYYESIKVYLYDELNDILEQGTELIDELTKEKYEFTFPLNDDNLESNVNKYINYLFNKEHLFVINKFNFAFNQTIKDADQTSDFSLFPNQNTSLYNVKDYFFNNLQYFTINPTELLVDKIGILVLNSTNLVFKLKIEDSSVEESGNITRTYTLSLNLLSNELIEFSDLKVSTSKTIPAGLEYPSEGSDEVTAIFLELKPQFLALSNINTLINYVFPLNKILNVAKVFFIQSNMKIYDQLSIAIDGSFKSIDTVHNTILGNEDKIECELPDDPLSLDNPILGINLEISKMIAAAPAQILKGLEETYDPNISVAVKLRDLTVAAGLPKTPVALWSLGLLPALTIPPPYGIGPPLISPWGYIYWGIDAGEVLTSYAKNGFDTDSKLRKPEINISVNPFKNKNC